MDNQMSIQGKNEVPTERNDFINWETNLSLSYLKRNPCVEQLVYIHDR